MIFLTLEQVAYMESLNNMPPGATARQGGRDYRVSMPEEHFRRQRDMHLNHGFTAWGTVVPTRHHLEYQRLLHTHLLNTYCSPPRDKSKDEHYTEVPL